MSSGPSYPEGAETLNSVLDTLGAVERRELISFFEQQSESETATLAELVSRIDERTPGTAPKHVRIRLLHRHLPKLESRGWLEFDRRDGMIRYHGHDAAVSLLRDLPRIFE